VAALAAAGSALVGLVRAAGVRRVMVEGDSMAPTLMPGDRLLVVRCRRLRPGDLVAVPDPRDRRRLLIKRIAEMRGGWIALRGDNGDASTDSRVFGDVPTRLVLGRVVRRYAPAQRRGTVR
jgi:inner membrane protease subunit 1